MFTTRSKSSNSKRCGTSASRSAGPISGSSLIIVKISSITVRNSLAESNSGSAIRTASRRAVGGREAGLLVAGATWRRASSRRRGVPCGVVPEDFAAACARPSCARAGLRAPRRRRLRRRGLAAASWPRAASPSRRRALERRDAAAERLDLLLDVLEHVELVDHLAQAAGGAGDLVDEVLRAGARGLGAFGSGVERPLDRRAHGADRVGCRDCPSSWTSSCPSSPWRAQV